MRYKEHDKVRVRIGTRDTGLAIPFVRMKHTIACNVIQKHQSVLKTFLVR